MAFCRNLALSSKFILASKHTTDDGVGRTGACNEMRERERERGREGGRREGGREGGREGEIVTALLQH